MQQRAVYNRTAAVQYALRHWNNPNPDFANMDTRGGGGDCTNFTSQALLAGGWPMDYRGMGFDREWSVSPHRMNPSNSKETIMMVCTWSLPEDQCRYLEDQSRVVVDPLRTARKCAGCAWRSPLLRWDSDGLLDHGSIVTGLTASDGRW